MNVYQLQRLSKPMQDRAYLISYLEAVIWAQKIAVAPQKSRSHGFLSWMLALMDVSDMSMQELRSMSKRRMLETNWSA